jgi:Flp pilus assembly protein TadD/negative regulator of sigma E activity
LFAALRYTGRDPAKIKGEDDLDMAVNQQFLTDHERIESWKGIAAYFGRDERTVKRWEKERSLPIRRVPGGRGGVFAYSQELATWWDSSLPEAVIEKQPSTPMASARGTMTAETVASPAEPVHPGDYPSSHPGATAAQPSVVRSVTPGSRRWRVTITVAAVFVLTALTGVLVHIARKTRSGNTSIAPRAGAYAADPPAQAKEYLLLGRYYWEQRTPTSLNRAVDAYTQAVVLDPRYAQAYAGLAESYDLMQQYGSAPNSEAFPRAITAANRAIQLDPSLGEAHRALAFALFYWDWDMKEAESEYKEAITLNPGDKEAHHWYATALLTMGRTSEARAEIAKARELDPASRAILADEAMILFYSGDAANGVEVLKNIEGSQPDYVAAPRYLATFYLASKDYPAYIAASKRASKLSGDPQENAVAKAAENGFQRAGAQGMLQQMSEVQKMIFDQGKSSGYDLAHTEALLGRKEMAVASLEAGFRARDFMLMTIFRGDLQTELKGYPPFERIEEDVRDRMENPQSFAAIEDFTFPRYSRSK